MVRSQHPEPHATVGWREWLSLPALGIDAIKAKIDTGARSSSLHAFDLHFFHKEGVEMVRFAVHPLQRDAKTVVHSEARVVERRKVKSSTGHESLRPVIVVQAKLGEHEWPIELTLANRDLMGFRMLLGRQAMRGVFLVDPGRSYVIGKKKRPRKQRKKRKSE